MPTSLESLFETSDIISLHLPLSEKTRHLVSTRTIALMNRKPIIINVSRGGLIDGGALACALKKGELSGAGVDVFEDEPNVRPELLGLENIVLTPHVAWYSEEAETAASPQLDRGNCSRVVRRSAQEPGLIDRRFFQQRLRRYCSIGQNRGSAELSPLSAGSLVSARLSNRVDCFKNVNDTSPVIPFRCLAIISLATPLSSCFAPLVWSCRIPSAPEVRRHLHPAHIGRRSAEIFFSAKFSPPKIKFPYPAIIARR
jgi:hypothetical protein